MNRYRYYKNSWIFIDESKEKLLSKDEADIILKEKGLMVRNIYDFDTKDETEFWFIIKDNFSELKELPQSTKTKIRRSSKIYNFKHSNKDFILNNCHDILVSREKSFDIKCKITSKEAFSSMLDEYESENKIDYWIVENKESGEVVAFSINRIKEKSCDYDFMSCKPEALHDRSYPYYGLFYEMNRYYLQEKGFRYVCDGSRSITEHSNIQPFLIYNFKFRKAYCKLKVHYKWWFGVVVKLLFPFRNLIPFRNVRAVLKMEEYSRSSQ